MNESSPNTFNESSPNTFNESSPNTFNESSHKTSMLPNRVRQTILIQEHVKAICKACDILLIAEMYYEYDNNLAAIKHHAQSILTEHLLLNK